MVVESSFFMDKKDILKYLDELNDELAKVGATAKVNIYGGAVMALVYDSRRITKDIDAIFNKKALIFRAIKTIAERHNLNIDWFNDAIRISAHYRDELILHKTYSNLLLFVPSLEQMIAMKSFAARWHKSDMDDLVYLLKKSNIQTVDEIVGVTGKFIPAKLIEQRHINFMEEALHRAKNT